MRVISNLKLHSFLTTNTHQLMSSLKPALHTQDILLFAGASLVQLQKLLNLFTALPLSRSHDQLSAENPQNGGVHRPR